VVTLIALTVAAVALAGNFVCCSLAFVMLIRRLWRNGR
jgi:hypothetical protein